jgi:hypothetical protein
MFSFKRTSLKGQGSFIFYFVYFMLFVIKSNDIKIVIYENSNQMICDLLCLIVLCCGYIQSSFVVQMSFDDRVDSKKNCNKNKEIFVNEIHLNGSKLI